MPEEINLETFEEKIQIIADELLGILKDLSAENREQINSKQVADKMISNESVKTILSGKDQSKDSIYKDTNFLKAITDTVLDRFEEIVPTSMVDQLGADKDQLHYRAILQGSTDWIDSPFNIIKQYITTLASRSTDLENFIRHTMLQINDNESFMLRELSTQQQTIQADNTLAENISSNMNMMQEEITNTNDIVSIKAAITSKIENINHSLREKKKQDMLRLQRTEKALQEMTDRMNEMKKEADEIRKKAEEAENESYHDCLTQLHNRKAYDEKIEETLANVTRYDEPASLIVCDIDFFKSINDTYGHKVGDLAIKKLATLLKERLRVNDFIARYGGEEFVVILPHTDLDGAHLAGEGIRSYIDKAVFSYKGQEIPLKVSVGISEFKKNDDSTSTFERADGALYLAKHTGRNQVKTEKDVLLNNLASQAQ